MFVDVREPVFSSKEVVVVCLIQYSNTSITDRSVIETPIAYFDYRIKHTVIETISIWLSGFL